VKRLIICIAVAIVGCSERSNEQAPIEPTMPATHKSWVAEDSRSLSPCTTKRLRMFMCKATLERMGRL